jgi:hypothetical protein
VGETSVYYVPDDEERWIGREHDVAEAFWSLGVFLVTKDRFIYERIGQWHAEGKALPEWEHGFSFAEMGFGGGQSQWDPVPNQVYELRCPHCTADLYDPLYEVWNDDRSSVPLPERTVACHACGRQVCSAEAKSQEPFTFARFYVWVADIDPGDWDASFKRTVESVLGPCREYMAWET